MIKTSGTKKKSGKESIKEEKFKTESTIFDGVMKYLFERNTVVRSMTISVPETWEI